MQDPVLICCPLVRGTFCVRQKLMKLLRDVREGTWPGSGVDCPSLAKPAMITLGSSSSDSCGSEDPALAEFVAAAALEVAVLVFARPTVLEAEAVDRMMEVENLDAVFDRTDAVVFTEAVSVAATLAEVVTPRTELSVALADVTAALVVTAVEVLVLVFPPRRVDEVDSTADSAAAVDKETTVDEETTADEETTVAEVATVDRVADFRVVDSTDVLA